MKCPVCYIARFVLLLFMILCCFGMITYDSCVAFVRTFLKDTGDLYGEVRHAVPLALRGE